MTATWTDPRGGNGTWTHSTPRPALRLTALGAVIAALLLTAVFLAVLAAGQRAMCATHRTAAGHGALRYCPDFHPQETR